MSQITAANDSRGRVASFVDGSIVRSESSTNVTLTHSMNVHFVDWRDADFGEICFGHQQTSKDAAYQVCKRCMDIVISVAAIVLLFPVIIIAAALIRICSRGPVLFTQIRVGKRGKTFRCFKFRSMVPNAESLKKDLLKANEHCDPRTFKIMDDPRITPLGRILRRFSIDELPQILNVLTGQMSIVGPRPPLPCEVAMYSTSDFQRLSVKPGLTCIWQISGRSRLPFSAQVKLDLEYIRTRGLAKDVAIILRTIPVVLSGDGAA